MLSVSYEKYQIYVYWLTRAIMDCKGTNWLKKEKNEVYAESGSLFDEDPLKMPSLHIKHDPELKEDLDGTEHHFLEDDLGLSWLNDIIKKDPELNLEVDETENTVAASIRNTSDSTSFIQSSGESCDISFEETMHQGIVNNELEIDAEKSTDFTVCSSYTKISISQEDSLFSMRCSRSIREKEFHKFNCDFCLKSFPSKYRLIMHVFNHIDGVQAPAYVCKSCGEVLPTDDCLKKHLRMSEVDQALSAANSEIVDWSDDHENIISLEKVREGTMEQTEKQSSSKKSRKTFKKSLHDVCNTDNVTQAAEKPIRCNDDGILSTSDNVHSVLCAKRLSALRRQKLIHTGERSHKCGVCGKSFTRSSTLKSHNLIHAGKRPYKCSVCGKSFTQSSNRRAHELIHTRKRPYKCDTCDKSFNVSSNLKRHVLIHTGERPYKCSVCGKSFNHPSNLKSHYLLHTRQRVHKCIGCENLFSGLGHVKAQRLIDTGKSPHKCDTCGKCFTSLGNLKKHH
ncbi:zinc finger protein 98-like [Schistocerca serialis cubense]|uniref:zinc finger protein 98-like n=1 Tax=Schistocerca serialis cubense TaxID=2023355 RepID=UPI00214EED16|nr:zinc finger protein 98-like [Schistocerca serialis cubense]